MKLGTQIAYSAMAFSLLVFSALPVFAESPAKTAATTKASPNPNTFNVVFDLVGLSRCMFGDLDALLLDLKTAAGTLGLQLSVESIGAGTESVTYGNALEEKTAATNFGSYSLSLPKQTSPIVFGAFLCSIDREHASKSPCSTQQLKSAEDLLRRYRVDSGALGGMRSAENSSPYSAPKSASPTIYYAQFFLVENGVVTPITESDSAIVSKALILKGIAKEKLSGITKTIGKYADTISSLPLESLEGRMQMQLPYYDQDKCMGR